VGAVGITLGTFALILIVFVVLRRNARRARTRALRREVELVEVVAPKQAEAVRDDILNRQVGALQRNPVPESNSVSEGNATPPRGRAWESPSGEWEDDGRETLPPYER
jgi:hypothetical protein